LLVSFYALSVNAKESNPKTPNETQQEIAEKEQPMHFETKGSERIDGKKITYTATAGTLVMKNKKHEPIAQFALYSLCR
jgi:carboxypeptidase C (cathepsin A)